MRGAVLAGVIFIGGLWIVAVLFGLVGTATGLTRSNSLLGRLARFCRAVGLLSP